MANPFIHRWTVDVDCMPKMLINNTVTDHRSNHLQQETLSVNWYLYLRLFIWVSFSVFLSILVVPIPWRLLSKSLMIKDGLLKQLSRKMVEYMSSKHYEKGKSNTGSKYVFLSYPSTSWTGTDVLSYLHSGTKIQTPILLVFCVCTASCFIFSQFDHVFINTLSKSVIEVAYYRSTFTGLVSSFIILVIRKM